VTVLAEPPEVAAEPPGPEPEQHEARGLLAFATTTDHKRIGVAYMVTAFAFFLIGGALAGIIRTELFSPGNDVVSQGRYNEVFTMHGTIMMFLFIGPFAFGLANYFVPLQIGAKDMAFPRLNAMSYWLYLFGGVTLLASFLTADGAADFGWTGYAPLSDIVRSPGIGADLWIMSIVLTGLSGIFTAVNVVATVIAMRAPGMRMFRMPIFTWNMLVTSVLVLIAFPVITAAGAMLFIDRALGGHIYDADFGGSAILWQHLFWFMGHPEVYIVVLPYFGIITEVIPVFSWRPVFGYAGIVFATITIAILSTGVWAHHMFTTGAVLLPFFTASSMLIAVPTGLKFFNWIGTMWGGRITFPTPMLFALGFLFTFLVGGITGVMLASAPIDFHVHDSYFVVAHMHYVLFGGSVFALYAGIYYWFPKVTGRVLSEGWGKAQFWMMIVGFHLTFFVQFILGLEGMPRRVADYLPSDGFTTYNRISSIGAALLGASTLPFLWNAWGTWKGRLGSPAGNDPWGAQTLEWYTTSPPPPHNFDELPPIRSERPVWDLTHGPAPTSATTTSPAATEPEPVGEA
jgi:cytochrome c oxidase subunit 1